MDIYMKIRLTIGLLYFLQTLTYIQGEYTYTYVGCFKDRLWSRALIEDYYKDDESNTIDKCVNFCGEEGHTYAGLQHSDQCWCGNSNYDEHGNGNGCILQCTGNDDQICGGNWRNSVFAIHETMETTTTTATVAKAATSSVVTLHKDTTTTTSISPTNTAGSAKVEAEDKRNTGLYTGIGLTAAVVLVIIVAVVVLAVHRRRYSRENNGIFCQMAVPNIYVDAPSAGQSNKPTSEPRNGTARLNYSVVNGDVYTVPQRSDKNNQ